jgi:hypothetical protein
MFLREQGRDLILLKSFAENRTSPEFWDCEAPRVLYSVSRTLTPDCRVGMLKRHGCGARIRKRPFLSKYHPCRAKLAVSWSNSRPCNVHLRVCPHPQHLGKMMAISQHLHSRIPPPPSHAPPRRTFNISAPGPAGDAKLHCSGVLPN